MAIAINLNWRGAQITSAYVRVEHVFGGPREGLQAVARIYASEAKANPPDRIEQRHVGDDPATGEPIYESVSVPVAPEWLGECNLPGGPIAWPTDGLVQDAAYAALNASAEFAGGQLV